jgi:hypothetical protein
VKAFAGLGADGELALEILREHRLALQRGEDRGARGDRVRVVAAAARTGRGSRGCAAFR